MFDAWRYENQYSLIALMKTIGYAMGEDDCYKKIKPILLRGRSVMTEKGVEELDSKLLPKMDLLSKLDKDIVYFERLEMIEREMKDIMKTTKIVIFIDDLDRCSSPLMVLIQNNKICSCQVHRPT